MILTRTRRGVGFLASVVFMAASGFLFAADDVSRAGGSKRDPFVPLITPGGYLMNVEPQENAALRLEGITFDPRGDSIAVINGELLRVGDEVSGAVVTTIEADNVTVIQDNKKVELALRREE